MNAKISSSVAGIVVASDAARLYDGAWESTISVIDVKTFQASSCGH